jgi:hypothetical protein
MSRSIAVVSGIVRLAGIAPMGEIAESGLEPQHEIAQAEFEEVWNEALKHVQ